MGEGSVWFSASIGGRKNAEARWLLPMICRRGGIDKSDIGAIRIMDTTTEFEISARAAESFAVKIRRPDKEDNIRIEALGDAPPREEVRKQEWTPKPHGKNAKTSDKPPFDKKAHYDTKRRDRGEPAHAGKPRHEHGAAAKPAFGKKKKKKFRG
jgi:ATP-dependent RNA helicase DeaD